MQKLFSILLLFISTYTFAKGSRVIKPEEEIFTYPSLALAASNHTTLFLQGRIADPEKNSKKRKIFTKALADILGIDNEDRNAIFEQRIALFLYDGSSNISFNTAKYFYKRI